MNNTLLVIDDSPTVRKLVELSFARKPWKLYFAASGKEGATLSEQIRPEVVLLDYVLPDMNGSDVCAELVRRGLHDLRVVLMTAKEERVRTQFASYPMVVDYVMKPFTAQAVVDKANSALRRRPGASSSASPSSSTALSTSDDKQALGQALYAVLRGKLNEMPRWMNEAPAHDPGPWLARRLLGADTVDLIARELGPLPGSTSRAVFAPPPPSPVTGIVDPLDVLEILEDKGKTGVLSIATSSGTWRCAVRGGSLVLVSNADPRVDLELSGALGTAHPAVTPELEADHESMRRPVLAAMVDADAGDRHERSLAAVASAAFASVFSHSSPTMTWREGPVMDEHLASRMKRLSVPQLRLEALRASPGDLPVPARNDLLGRPAGFSAKVPAFDLTQEERAVLTLASEPVTLGEIEARSGLSTAVVETIVRRLSAVGLLERQRRERTPQKSRARIGVAEPCAATRAALGEILSAHLPDVEIAMHETMSGLETAIGAGAPRMLVTNVTNGLAEATRFVAHVRNELRVDGPLVAVLDVADPELERELGVMGFDGVLVKPYLVDDVIAFLESA